VTGFLRSGQHPPGTFTDDTQMTIAVARALMRAGHQDVDALMAVMGQEFMAWAKSPQNNRAPGGTCLTGCRNLADGLPWREAGVTGSKGCGAAMRAAPLGLLFYDDDVKLTFLSAAQSAPTHLHPTGVLSSVAAAAPVAWVMRGNSLDGIVEFTRACVERADRAMLLSVGCTAELVDKVGNREMLRALDRLGAALDQDAEDVCELLGGAWVGEEAVACALWCVLKAKGDFRESVLRGTNSSGDSDSIACIAGSIAGALGGVAAIPADWVRDVEKSAVLDALAVALHTVRATGKDIADPDPSLDVFNAHALMPVPAAVKPEPPPPPVKGIDAVKPEPKQVPVQYSLFDPPGGPGKKQ